MKIAWLTLDSLYPLDSAGRLGVYKRLENIYKDHEIYLFYFYSNEIEKESSKALEDKCKLVKGYCREKNKFKLLINYLRVPYTVATRINNKLVIELSQCIKENGIELINVDFPQMGYALLKCNGIEHIPIVMNQHNIEWQRFEEISKSSSISKLKKMIASIEAIRLKKFEKNLYKKICFRAFTFVTPEDKEYFEHHMNFYHAKLKVIPGGAEYRVSPDENTVRCNKELIFVGVMSNELNPEGALWFVDQVLPRIKNVIPDIKFTIVGKDPVKALLNLNVPGVTVTGFVNDLSVYYNRANAVVIPVLHGGGVKLKLLEAMGYGKIVISTSAGVKGTNFIDLKHILIADSPKEFAEYCIDVIMFPEKYSDLLLEASKVFREQYTWKGIGKQYSMFLSSLTERT